MDGIDLVFEAEKLDAPFEVRGQRWRVVRGGSSSAGVDARGEYLRTSVFRLATGHKTALTVRPDTPVRVETSTP
jgi:hypothetical protein